jgi:hypothetical protein
MAIKASPIMMAAVLVFMIVGFGEVQLSYN